MSPEAQATLLKTRVDDLLSDREAARAEIEKDRQFLHDTQEKMVMALGEAAKKPAPTATATATSTGTGSAKTDSDPPSLAVVSAPASAAQPVAPLVPAPVSASAPRARGPAPRKVAAPRPSCEKLSAAP